MFKEIGAFFDRIGDRIAQKKRIDKEYHHYRNNCYAGEYAVGDTVICRRLTRWFCRQGKVVGLKNNYTLIVEFEFEYCTITRTVDISKIDPKSRKLNFKVGNWVKFRKAKKHPKYSMFDKPLQIAGIDTDPTTNKTRALFDTRHFTELVNHHQYIGIYLEDLEHIDMELFSGEYSFDIRKI